MPKLEFEKPDLNQYKLSYITDHAARYVWAYPRQDDQFIIQPAIISPYNGYRNAFTIEYHRFVLPEKVTKFHVYQVGQLNPEFIGLFPEKRRWIRIDEICNTSQMVVDIYTVDGIQIPRSCVWYRWTRRNNLIFTVKPDSKVPWDFHNEKLFFRVYSNAYFNVLRKNMQKDFVVAKSIKVVTKQDINEIFDFLNTYRVKPGHVFINKNGISREMIQRGELVEGDNIDMLYDSTVYKKVAIKLTNLRTFDSILDKKRKYLFAYAKERVGNVETIDFHDDIDFHVYRRLKNNAENTYHGIYLHRNAPDTVRQVTHRDYALCVPYIKGLIRANNQNALNPIKQVFETGDDVWIHAYIRKGMRDRPLVYNSHKLHELEKLPFPRRVGAMLGIRSNVSIWRADELEKSLYIEIMSSPNVTYDKEKVELAYGYRSIARLTGYTPTLEKDFIVQGKSTKIALYPALTKYSNVWEYDKDGHLITYRNHYYSCDYELADKKNTKMVEVVSGTLTLNIGNAYDQERILLKDDEQWRVYRCEKGLEDDLSNWEDVTDNENNYYVIEEETDSDGNTLRYLKWIVDNRYHTTFFKTDAICNGSRVTKPMDNGVIDFYLAEIASSGPRKGGLAPMWIPGGILDVWLNGHALVRGIDYFVDFPKVTIVAKNYLDSVETGKSQKIDWRFHGFCNKDLSMIDSVETGYVRFSRLSYNDYFNCRDDKLLHCVLGGAVYDRSVLGYSEDGSACNIPGRDNEIVEGQPYQINEIIVPRRDVSLLDTYTERNKSITNENQIEGYMNQFLPENKRTDYRAIRELYPLYSPFIAWIIDDLIRNTFVFDKLKEHYSDEDVLKACAVYEDLLKVDPVHQDTCIDYEYVIIHPHPHDYVIELDIYKYTLLQRIIKLYMRGRINTANFIRVKPV